jgi:hypothetical protein
MGGSVGGHFTAASAPVVGRKRLQQDLSSLPASLGVAKQRGADVLALRGCSPAEQLAAADVCARAQTQPTRKVFVRGEAAQVCACHAAGTRSCLLRQPTRRLACHQAGLCRLANKESHTWPPISPLTKICWSTPTV